MFKKYWKQKWSTVISNYWSRRKTLKELKDIDQSKTLEATGKISKKIAEANNILLDIKEIDTKLDTWTCLYKNWYNLLILNTTLILLHSHENLLKKFLIMKLL